MSEIWQISMILVSILNLVFLISLLNRKTDANLMKMEVYLAGMERNQEKLERMIQSEMAQNREEFSLRSNEGRRELSESLNGFGDLLLGRMTEIATLQKNQLDGFANQLSIMTQVNERKLEKMRETVEQRLTLLQDDNGRRLEQMRATVDEKLHATLEKRLGESFKQVSDRLEQVHKGLGEMQSLASGVGDLKKVLTNIKTRGTWGEMQLGNLLDQVLTMEQYAQNVVTKKGSSERVEFALKLPGGREQDQDVWLPIDAKFPQEDFQRLLDARDESNLEMVEEAGRMLEARIRTEAKDIKEKYLDPPNTTDFGIMFLPSESLYAEVLRRPGLCEALQRVYRVVVTGPTTLAALLNSLQMGFRTLAIEKRSSEVWSLLGAVKTEFGRFGEILDKTQKKLQEASSTIENAAKKSRTIERKLKQVQELPIVDAVKLLDEDETAV